MFQTMEQKNQIRFGEVNSEVNSSKTKLKIQLRNFTKYARVHLFAQQFINNMPDQMRDSIEDALRNTISISRFPFSNWKNMFLANNDIGDEMRYVLKRQQLDNQLGNSLDKPTLLINPNFIRNTTTAKEKLAAAQEFA